MRNAAIGRREICLQRSHGKGFERRSDISCGGIVAGYEEPLDRSSFMEHPLEDEQERNEIATANPAVNEWIDGRPMPGRGKRTDECRRLRAHDRQQRLD